MASVQVVPHANGWKVVEDGEETGEIYETQERAAEAARSRAQDKGVEVQIQSEDGTIRENDSDGNAPGSIKG